LRDETRGVARLEKAGTDGDARALEALSDLYFIGASVPYDLAAARAHASQLCSVERSAGELMIATIDLYVGDAAAREVARRRMRESAEAGNRRALLAYGYGCATGEAFAVDLDRAWWCVEQLARQDMPAARAALAATGSNRRARLERVFGELAPEAPDPREMAERMTIRMGLLSDPDSRPQTLLARDPIFPAAMREAGVSGTAEVSFVVGADGVPGEVVCTAASHPMFAAAAETCIRNWWFLPARKEGKPVSSRATQSFNFILALATKPAPEETGTP
jgi:TonB family protein